MKPWNTFALLLPACLLLSGLALFPGRGLAADEPEPPVSINAEEMEYFSEKNVVIFTGNAIAVRGNMTLSASRMEVTFTEGGGRDQSSIEKIVAEENVHFRQYDPETERERFATGERGKFTAEGRTVVLTGHPKIWEGKNVITGKVMTFYLDDQKFHVEGDKDEPVGLTVFPDKQDNNE